MRLLISFLSSSSMTKIGLFLFSLLEVSAYTLTTTTTRNNNNIFDSIANIVIGSPTTTATTNDRRRNTGNTRISSLLLLNQKGRNIEGIYQRKKKRKCLCPPEDDNDDKNEDDDMLDALSLLNEDRREVLFAMMGSMWSISATAAAVVGSNPQPVYATYGMDAKIELPDVIAGMNDRQNKQCLVESLGNRECLVYKETDPNKLLYKGANSQILLDRIQLALNSLDLIPSLVETKKWNDINSILIGGPMGQLSLTLNLLSKDNPDPECIKLIRKIKEDCFAIGTATTQRQCNDILKYNDKAKNDMKEFILLLS